MTLKVRPMLNEDIEHVYAIEQNVHITPWSKEIIRDCVLVGYDCQILEFCLGLNKGIIIGYSIARYHNNSYHLLNFCIASNWQAKGLGKQFLKTLLETLKKNKNINYAILEVRPSNVKAVQLYKSMGFIPTEVKKDYYKDVNSTEDAIIFKKNW